MTKRNFFQIGFVSILILLTGCQKSTIDVESPTPREKATTEETSGRLVSATKTSSLGVGEAVSVASENFGKLELPVEKYQPEITKLLKGPFSGIQWQVETYRITYHTLDANNNDKILSADIGFVNDASGRVIRKLSTVSLFHCQFNANDKLTMLFKDIVIPLRAMHNALVVYPHYQGAGEDKGKEGTYIPISESLIKARQAIDAELAALEFIRTLHNVSMDCGYYTENMGVSNGGSTALATQYLLENDETYSKKDKSVKLRTTCVGEGCYDYGELIISMFRDTEVETSVIVTKLMPFAFVSFINSAYETWKNEYFGSIGINQYFSKKFNDVKVKINGKTMGILEAMSSGDFPIDFSEESIFEENGLTTIRSMINPELYNKCGNLIEYDPRITALEKAFDENQLLQYEWQPKSALLIEHSAKDDMLPYADALEAYNVLSNKGKNKNVIMKTMPIGDHIMSSSIYLLEMLLFPHPVPLD